MKRKHLLDVNAFIALVDHDHLHHERIQDWFLANQGACWGLCPLSEAGFLRIVTNAAFQATPYSMKDAIALLRLFKQHSQFEDWPIEKSWVDLTAPFAQRIIGHRQVTDAYLLGLAIEQDGVLVTFDKGVRYLAGAEFARNVLVLE